LYTGAHHKSTASMIGLKFMKYVLVRTTLIDYDTTYVYKLKGFSESK
jgi:hypothetical protein